MNGLFLSGEQIAELPTVEIDVSNHNEYEIYLKRGNKTYLRNSFAKIIIDSYELKEVIKSMGYGQKLIIKS